MTLRNWRHTCPIAILLLVALVAPSHAREFRLGLITPPGHLWTQAAERFRDAIAGEGGDRVTVFPSRQLGNEAQMLQLLQTGALDFAILTVSEISNRLPQFGALYAPYLVCDASGAVQLLRSAPARKLLDDLPLQLGVFGVGYTMAGMRQVLSRDAVTTTADLRGKKLRITPFAPVRDFYQIVGAAPTPMPLSSVFDALANGQIDAIDMDLESIWKLRYYEYGHSLVLSRHMMFPAVAVMSGKTWLALSALRRQQLMAALQLQLDWVLDSYPALEQQWEQQLAATDLDIIDGPTRFFEQAGAIWEQQWLPRAPALTALKQVSAHQLSQQGCRHDS